MRKQVVLLAAALILPSLGAKAADLVVWWQKGYYNQEDDAIRETIAAFEQETGKQVELVIEPQEALRDNLLAAIEAGRPPDFAFSSLIQAYSTEWAFENRLVDLTDAVGPFSTCSIRICSPG